MEDIVDVSVKYSTTKVAKYDEDAGWWTIQK